MGRNRKTKTKKPTKNLNEMTPKGAERRKELAEQFGEGVISLIEREQFWFRLVYDLKRADAEAEQGILGVIQGGDIGNHEVIEKKEIEDSIRRIAKMNPVTKRLPPLLKF